MNTMKLLKNAVAMLLLSTPMLASAEMTIVVTTAEEFVSALGSNRTIIIDSSVPLIITPVVDLLVEEGSIEKYKYYSHDNNAGLGYYDNFDGNGLSITGFRNLTIKSKEGRAKLLSTPRYADVLTFERCENIVLKDLIFGHTEEGYCECGVLGFTMCDQVRINNCDLFGCGTEGLALYSCGHFYMDDCCIHDCSYHTMHIFGSFNVVFSNCWFYDNREFDQINVFGSEAVRFEDCQFRNLKGNLFNLECPIVLVRGNISPDCQVNWGDPNIRVDE